MNCLFRTENLKRVLRGLTAAVIAALAFACPRSAMAEDPGAGELVREAGNAATEEARLDALRRLETLPETDVRLAQDAGRLAGFVEQWVAEPRLDFFWRDFRKEENYDFGIAADSPLHPLTCLYRGRMMLWANLEFGGYANPERWEKARRWFAIAHDAHPDNPVLRMHLGQALPAPNLPAPHPDAPAWANAQRAALEQLAGIIHWWIDHRMAEDGQYGGGWGDDCEMWRWWTPVLLGFEDPKINAAQARFSAALLGQPHMRGGYTSKVYDVEHTSEDTSDAITPMMHLDPENPEWRERVMRLADLFENLWTGVNDRGFRQFKSTYFSDTKVDPSPARACDTAYHPRAMQPALLLWQRTGDTRLGRLFTAWMDTWADAAARNGRGKPAGVLPGAVHWPDGEIGGLGPDWWDPQNHDEPGLYRWPGPVAMLANTLLLAHHMTGGDKYLASIRDMAAMRLRHAGSPPGEPQEAGGEAWCAARMGWLGGVLGKYRLATGDTGFDALLARDAPPYLSLRLNGERGPLEAALDQTARALSINFEGYTSEVRYTDRVLRFPSIFERGKLFTEGVPGIPSPDSGLLYATVTGDPGDAGYFPLNAVRWRTPAKDLAALVTDSGTDRFAAELFHFGDTPRDLRMELLLLAPGEYRLRVDCGGDTKESTLAVAAPRPEVTVTLPGGQLAQLFITRES